MPDRARAVLVFAHGAGADMHHAFMAAVAGGLAARQVATLRYQFASAEDGARRPCPAPLAQATVRAAVAVAGRIAPSMTLLAGGKSFGGRMTSQAQAALPLPGVRGLVFLGFPLHQGGRPSEERARHLEAVTLPMLFVSGTRDRMATPALLRGVVGRLEPRATLAMIEAADHGLHVTAGARTDADAMAEALDGVVAWLAKLGL